MGKEMQQFSLQYLKFWEVQFYSHEVITVINEQSISTPGSVPLPLQGRHSSGENASVDTSLSYGGCDIGATDGHPSM